MKKNIIPALFVLISLATFSCRSTKKIQTAINKKDTSSIVITDQTAIDSIKVINTTLDNLNKSHIDFKTFSGKIKVEYVDNKGKKSNVTTYFQVVKDSVMWFSMWGSIFNVEAFRVLITKDSVILMNKLNKEVQYRSLNYLQDVTGIPFDFKTLQDLLVGNPIYFDTTVVAYKQTEDKIMLSTVGKYFKHLLTLNNSGLLLRSKLDDVDITRSRTADITYSEYAPAANGINFSTFREITVSEKNRLDVRLNFKQYEFNKDFTVTFNVPKNYKKR